ncbi:sugar phosphate isomerase/epimerase family protein [Herbiconiux ginsengi]|uniref:Sugar phosphate isomerase/epimerase n=1 Tax=Herbiconiux ginsengi TaxID=381665 RepID=A0A1H3THE3_9MICO|nr:sugar phosphate isomerase/epimerase family protein [Herbiconiux ginsengi]SDZ49288.1 Sugar phosphate isomerase/epimerase [Herbiconiux ginsengi]
MNALPRRVAETRLSINTVTLGNPPLHVALDAIAATGARNVGLWRETYDGKTARQAAKVVADHGLQVSTLCRCVLSTDRHTVADARRAIDDAHQLGAAALVVLAGGLPPGSRDLAGARTRVTEVFADIATVAGEAGVRLGLEPLHPMFTARRSVVNTLRHALDVVAPFPPETAGVVVDTFNVWWDAELIEQIRRAGAENRIAAVQVADWSWEHEHGPFLTRVLPGDGIIDITGILSATADAHYTGPIEVEIFNDLLWQKPPHQAAHNAWESLSASLR